MRILALDQGTTSTRLLAFDGGVSLVGQRRHLTSYPAPGWVEQDAEEILANCRALLAGAGPADAIGLANQGESCLAWDGATGQPLSPIVVWQDRRTLADLALLAGDAAEVTARSGLPLDPYFSASKLGWLLRNLPAVQQAKHLRLGTTDAFLLDRLTGHFATDRATASRTGLMNLTTGEWDPDLCRIFGVPMECLPQIRGNLAGFGTVQGVPVTAAIVDQQGALYGHGCRKPGQVKVTFGTGAFVLAVSDLVQDTRGLLPTVAWDLGQITYGLDGGVQDAGSAVEWALRAGLADSLADFDTFTAPPAIARNMVFLPAFSGLGAPHWDRSAAPMMIGLTPDMTRRDMCQSLLEGVAWQTAVLLDEMAACVPLQGPVSVDGGLSASGYFVQMLADLSGRQIAVAEFSERTAYGVARLAAQAIGGDLAEPGGARRIDPRPIPAHWHDRFAQSVTRSRGWQT